MLSRERSEDSLSIAVATSTRKIRGGPCEQTLERIDGTSNLRRTRIRFIEPSGNGVSSISSDMRKMRHSSNSNHARDEVRHDPLHTSSLIHDKCTVLRIPKVAKSIVVPGYLNKHIKRTHLQERNLLALGTLHIFLANTMLEDLPNSTPKSYYTKTAHYSTASSSSPTAASAPSQSASASSS
jgi:hypothetical protein